MFELEVWIRFRTCELAFPWMDRPATAPVAVEPPGSYTTKEHGVPFQLRAMMPSLQGPQDTAKKRFVVQTLIQLAKDRDVRGRPGKKISHSFQLKYMPRGDEKLRHLSLDVIASHATAHVGCNHSSVGKRSCMYGREVDRSEHPNTKSKTIDYCCLPPLHCDHHR